MKNILENRMIKMVNGRAAVKLFPNY